MGTRGVNLQARLTSHPRADEVFWSGLDKAGSGPSRACEASPLAACTSAAQGAVSRIHLGLQEPPFPPAILTLCSDGPPAYNSDALPKSDGVKKGDSSAGERYVVITRRGECRGDHMRLCAIVLTQGELRVTFTHTGVCNKSKGQS